MEGFARKGWLKGCVLGQVDWRGKNLAGCDFLGSIYGANLKSAFLTNSRLVGRASRMPTFPTPTWLGSTSTTATPSNQLPQREPPGSRHHKPI